ncbi:hypothetical protein AGR5A_Lc70015 [Agrobacterium genomosp. 5 str. CFBP 6626]|nr:hypothetical protein AGR5A_Lc70015 [Agrobacterium genomosp. 5 str. CFBP 6626]
MFFCAANWVARTPNDIARRPNGVVTHVLSMSFTFHKAKENRSPKNSMPKTLDYDSRK